MADNTPKPQSYEQILSEALSAYAAKTGVNDLNVGSLSTSLFEVVALLIARSSGDSFQILRDLSVDRASGESLQRIAADEGLKSLPARVSSGQVTITDTSFAKISTKVYAGGRAPNIGTATINVSDATSFPATGSVYIGRGSPNVEGPIAYSAKTQVGGYWQLTLTSPTTKFHNINEQVTLSQGGLRNIPSGTVVKSPASGASPDINFEVTQAAIILDGEVSVSYVPVSGQEPGTSGNVPIGAIKAFGSNPFSGATVKNELPFKTGRDTETDEELRIRIKRARLSKGLGTALAVKSSVIGATPNDENTTVVSDELETNDDGRTTLYIDDGTGYEEKSAGVGIETIIESALGGEKNFQLETGGRQTSLAKAFIISNLSAPFDVAGTDTLAVSVGGITTEHTFSTTDFISPGGAIAYEIVASINANSSLNFEATTAEGGTKIALYAKAEDNEDIQAVNVTIGRNVSELIGLPSNKVETLRLSKNKQPLSKDGLVASVFSEHQANWSPTLVTGDTLILAVDGTDAITYTITDADFLAEGTHVSVSYTNSLESWKNVFNTKLTGITASIVGEQIVLVSNLGANNRAELEIDPASTLVVKNLFSVDQGLVSLGKGSDYELSRNTGQFRLNVALEEGDELTVGTRDIEARVQSVQILGGTVTLSADAYLWLLIDDQNAEIINTGVISSTLIAVSKPSANIVRYTSATANAMANVQVGDYVIVWSEELSATNRLEGRVNAKTSTTLDLKVTAAEYASAVVESGILFQEGFTVVHTVFVPQKFKVAAGTKTVNDIADELNLQSSNCQFSVIDEEILVINTKTKSSPGSVLVVTFDESGKSLAFTAGVSDTSKDSLTAFYESGYKEGSFPSFIHSSFASEAFASPPDTFISAINSTLNLTAAGIDPNVLIRSLQPYGTILDALSPSEITALDDFAGAALTIDQDNLVKRLRLLDRYFLAQPLDFAHDDEAVVVLDNDASNKTFAIPFFRNVKTNTTLASNPNTFNAYDLDAGPTSPFTTFFDSAFAFDNFKVLMRAKKVINPSATEDAILYRSKQWGRSGEKINISYIYPTAPNSGILHTVLVQDDVFIKLILKSGAAVPTAIDGTTEWDVTITPNTPVAGVDQVTYTYTGTGTAPSLGALVGGEYVTISQSSELNTANTGTFRVSDEVGFTPTANSFTTVRQNGEAVAENDKATVVSGVFSFYNATATTAAEMVTYVSANLTNLIEASLVNDSGLTGAGVIDRSTEEESDFTIDGYYLQDGLNWLSTSNISGSPQFTFKRSLTLPTDTGYAFNQGEEIRFIPTTIDQVSRFLNVLAVTGYATLGEISTTARDGRLELSTKMLGGEGSVQIVGGSANSSETPIVGAAAQFENQFTIASIERAGLKGIESDSWITLQAANKQKKESLFKNSASIQITADSPSVGKSTIRVGNRTLTDRHFGKPRNHLRTQGRTFKVEQQGDLTCISWDNVGTQPFFSKSLNLNATAGGTLNIEKIIGSSEAYCYILTGPINFTEVSIGDFLEVSGMVQSANDGTFLVTGVSEDGKTIRVLNSSAVSEFSNATATISDNTNITGDEFIVDGNSLIAGVDFTVGATAADTAASLASAISALPGVSALAVSNVVTITATSANASISLFYNDLGGGGGGSVSGASLVGPAYLTTDFDCVSEVSEGDQVFISDPFAVLNRGKFRVIRRYENSIYFTNDSSVEETVTLPLDSVSLGYDGTTQFQVVSTSNKLKLRWTGTGTEPSLQNAQLGDELTLGTDFLAANQGTFMVTKAEAKLQEITRATLVAGNVITTGDYWFLNAGAALYYVWYNVDGGGGDPLIGGRTGIAVAIASADSATVVAGLTKNAIDAEVDFSATVSSNEVTITTVAYAETADATEEIMSAAFELLVLQQGQRTFIEAVNPAVVAEAAVLITNVLQVHRPQMLFTEYEASTAGDVFIVSSDFMGSDNQDHWVIEEIVDQDTIVVIGTMLSVESTGVNPNAESLLIEEEVAYLGYKKIRLITIDPNNSLRGIMVLDGIAQSSKINDSGEVQIASQNKLGFSTILRKGLDSYRYHTGLIGEANRIVYGDPRDSTTYPGSGAAGAEIFIRGPLTKRVKVAINIRLETGIPFAQIVEQVRTNVASLIDGNPVGQAIAISDIVETVNTIPGVRAVTISSPLYNSTNDTIAIGIREKSRIIDAVNDISVSQIGS